MFIAQTREETDETIDTIQDRLSPPTLREQVQRRG
ncbi:MAG: DUF3618 domain-containing protein [Sphaerobacteraceae bacterium]|nr:MAG: DUF3618 domain-containing protein [Sphaerobacteraceae bacterium]